MREKIWKSAKEFLKEKAQNIPDNRDFYMQ